MKLNETARQAESKNVQVEAKDEDESIQKNYIRIIPFVLPCLASTRIVF